MSLTLTYHSREFGIVCSDGRMSRRLPDGRNVAVQETAKKFIVLRADPAPGLVLAGSSSLGSHVDFSVYDAVRGYVEKFPQASFDQVAGIIIPTVDEVRARAVSQPRSFLWKLLFPLKTLREVIGLNLLGFDRERACVRNRAFTYGDHSWEESEHESGLTTAGFLEPEERSGMGQRLVSCLGNERTVSAMVGALLSVEAELSASHPETIGPPYSLHLVTKPTSCSRGVIEEEFRRALAMNQLRAA